MMQKFLIFSIDLNHFYMQRYGKIPRIGLSLQKNIAMRNTLFILLAIVLLSSCHESLEKRAEREAREYTERNCPTPVNNFTRTDSVVFYADTKTYTYYCSVTDKMDDANLLAQKHAEINDQLVAQIREDTNIKQYKEAGFNFSYIIHSTKVPGKVLFKAIITPKDYK